MLLFRLLAWLKFRGSDEGQSAQNLVVRACAANPELRLTIHSQQVADPSALATFFLATAVLIGAQSLSRERIR